MDEEIIEALKKADATEQGCGQTIKRLLESTGRNLDTVLMSTRRLLREKKVQVSSSELLLRNPGQVWPAPEPGRMEVTGEAVAKALQQWKEQNYFPIVVWLGPTILEQIEKDRKTSELHELFKAAVTRGDDNPRVNPSSIVNNYNATSGSIIQVANASPNATQTANVGDEIQEARTFLQQLSTALPEIQKVAPADQFTEIREELEYLKKKLDSSTPSKTMIKTIKDELVKRIIGLPFDAAKWFDPEILRGL